jgi:hypothetical protein
MEELYKFAGGSFVELKEIKKLTIEEYYIYLDSQYKEPEVKMPNEFQQ